MRWLSSAASQGLDAAQNNLGVLYENGEGVQQDLVRAYMWFSLSAAQGYVAAVKNANILAQRMTPAQLDEGNTLVRGLEVNRTALAALRRGISIRAMPTIVQQQPDSAKREEVYLVVARERSP